MNGSLSTRQGARRSRAVVVTRKGVNLGREFHKTSVGALEFLAQGCSRSGGKKDGKEKKEHHHCCCLFCGCGSLLERTTARIPGSEELQRSFFQAKVCAVSLLTVNVFGAFCFKYCAVFTCLSSSACGRGLSRIIYEK